MKKILILLGLVVLLGLPFSYATDWNSTQIDGVTIIDASDWNTMVTFIMNHTLLQQNLDGTYLNWLNGLLTFNQTKLNSTILTIAGSAGQDGWNITGSNYLYNNSNILFLNETKLNHTIDARSINIDTNDTVRVDSLYANISKFLNNTQLSDAQVQNIISTQDVYLRNTGDTASGNFTFDSTTFKIDSTNDRIGVGIINPLAYLHVFPSTSTVPGIQVDSDNANDILLKFNTPRAWYFTQGGTGASTTLQLRSEVADKSFNILNSQGNTSFSFFTSTSSSSSSEKDLSITPQGSTRSSPILYVSNQYIGTHTGALLYLDNQKTGPSIYLNGSSQFINSQGTWSLRRGGTTRVAFNSGNTAVYDNTGTALIYLDDKFVGINKTDPTKTLDVNGDVLISGNLTTDYFNVTKRPSPCSLTNYFTVDWWGYGQECAPINESALTVAGTVQGGGATNRIAFWNASNVLDSSSNLFFNETSNSVGIGTSSPCSGGSNCLDVSGELLNGGGITTYGGLEVASGDTTTQYLRVNGHINQTGASTAHLLKTNVVGNLTVTSSGNCVISGAYGCAMYQNSTHTWMGG